MTECSKDIDKAEAGDLRLKTKGVGNPKYMTLKQLENITNDPYFRGMHGADYETIKEEIEERLWELQNKKAEKDMEKYLEEMEEYEEILKATGSINNDNLFKAAKDAADAHGFDDKEIAFWQCNVFSQAVAKVAQYLNRDDVELVIAEATWQTDSGDCQAGAKHKHVLLKFGNKYVDFTLKQIDEYADFPYVSNKLPKYIKNPKYLNIEHLEGSNTYVESLLEILGLPEDAVEKAESSVKTIASVDWVWPTKSDFDNEWKTEDFLSLFSNGYESEEKQNAWKELLYNKLKGISEVKVITKDMLNPRNPDYYPASSIDELKQAISRMGKDVDATVKQFESDGSLFMPILINDKGIVKTLGGRTRLSIAFILNKPVKGIIIDKEKLNEQVISPLKRKSFLEMGSIFVQENETKQAVLDYIDGKISMEEFKKFPEVKGLDDKEIDYLIKITGIQIKKTKAQPLYENLPKYGAKAMKELLAKNGIKVKNGKIARADFNKAVKVLSCNMESLMLEGKKLDEEFAKLYADESKKDMVTPSLLKDGESKELDKTYKDPSKQKIKEKMEELVVKKPESKSLDSLYKVKANLLLKREYLGELRQKLIEIKSDMSSFSDELEDANTDQEDNNIIELARKISADLESLYSNFNADSKDIDILEDAEAKACVMKDLLLTGKELETKKLDKLLVNSKSDKSMKGLINTKEVLEDDLAKVYNAKEKQKIEEKIKELVVDSKVPLKEKDFYAKAAVIERGNKIQFEAIGGGLEVFASTTSLGDKSTTVGLNGFGSGSVNYSGDSSLFKNLEELKGDIVSELHQVYNEADKKISKIMLSYNLKRK